MRPSLALLCLLLIAGAVSSAHSQAPQPQRGPDKGTSTFVNGIDVLPVPTLPFSAVDKITWTRPLDGGGSITTYGLSKIFRDSQGRLHREAHRFSLATTIDPQTTLYRFIIYDPIIHTHTECEVATHLCHVTRYNPRLTPPPIQPVGQFDQGRRFLSRENIGNQSINGLDTIGTRETLTIQPGTIGNDQLLTESREFWYAPDLQINMTVTRKDPRNGTQLLQLINFSRSEPDPSVFDLPAGYHVVDDRVAPPQTLGRREQGVQ
jgi:hypothetical protein